MNYITGAIIAALVILSVVLTPSVLFPDATNARVILGVIGGGGVATLIVAGIIIALNPKGKSATPVAEIAMGPREEWRMPPLDQLPPARLSLAAKSWMGAPRLYLVVAGGLALFRVVMLAIGQG